MIGRGSNRLRSLQARRGYALLSVLWLCVGIVGLASAISVTTRDALATSRNRIAITEATWSARACMAFALAAVERALHSQGGSRVPTALAWHRVEGILATTALPQDLPCRLSASAMGSRLDLNTADSATVVRLLRSNGVRAALADSATNALLLGRPYSSLNEIRAVGGLSGIANLDTLVAIGTGAVALNHAHPEVLAALPGFTPEAVERVGEARARGRPIQDFIELSRALSPPARETFDAALPSLLGMVVLEPVAWLVTARRSEGRPPMTAVIEVRIGQLDGRVGISRRRTWTE